MLTRNENQLSSPSPFASMQTPITLKEEEIKVVKDYKVANGSSGRKTIKNLRSSDHTTQEAITNSQADTEVYLG